MTAEDRKLLLMAREMIDRALDHPFSELRTSAIGFDHNWREKDYTGPLTVKLEMHLTDVPMDMRETLGYA